MSTSKNVFPERKHLSNVSFSSLSSEVLHVRIRKMSGEESTSQTATSSREVSNKPFSDKSEKSGNSSSMPDIQETTPVLSQTLPKGQKDASTESHVPHDSSPCLKHAAANISRKACDIPSEKIGLCNSCSKSMLSYIFLVQDFLDSLAKEINGDDASHCLQCARQQMRNSISKFDTKDECNVEQTYQKHSDKKTNTDSTLRKIDGSRQKRVSHERRSGNTMFKGDHCQDPQQPKDYQGVLTEELHQKYVNNQKHTEFICNVIPPNVDPTPTEYIPHANDDTSVVTEQSISESSTTHQTSEQNYNFCQQWMTSCDQKVKDIVDNNQRELTSPKNDSFEQFQCTYQSSLNSNTELSSSYVQMYKQPNNSSEFRTMKERIQPNYKCPTSPIFDSNQNNPSSNLSPSLYKEDLDGIVSTLSTAERDIYESARGRAGWESFTETHERLTIPAGISSEAFVTSCRNNAEAIGCLVLGTSLLLCRTSKTLCVLVSEGVSTAFKSAFSEVFQVVQFIKSLDSLGTTKLALLEQPELGVTFEKLNIWRLVQFTKCVYLNPDTLVIQNCDELFSREELSAVPDIGWPDCFNSGVFVYCPSVHTFWQLLEFAEKQGSYDGGDQGLLNSYFNSWSSDINKKLSFIYNLMANVSYTYSPAFKQFGREVRIVQFHGSFKPWHVKFLTKTGQISPSSSVHPTYIQFVHIWINIFRITVLRLLSEEIQSYAASQEVISAVEMLRFFPLPSESESEFFLTPPSVRLRLAEKKLYRSAVSTASEARRRKSAEVFRRTITEDEALETLKVTEIEKTESVITGETKADAVVVSVSSSVKESTSETEKVFKESKAVGSKTIPNDGNTLPGSEIGDYQGMKAWEQGRMDYEGSAGSDNIIKRLEFLMNPKSK